MSENVLRSEFLDYEDGDTVCEGNVAYDTSNSAKRPCVLVAHAWDGLNGSSRTKAMDLARMGYVGFALDVYGKGVRGDAIGDNSHLMAPFMNDRALLRRRLLAALAAARRHPFVESDQIAVIGYCFGGLCALDLARSAAPGLLAAVSFHGVLQPPRLGRQQPIVSKILILHGWQDPLALPGDVLAVARELSDAGADWQMNAFGCAMHAFTNPLANSLETGMMYDPIADRRSWTAMTSFLKEAFGAAASASR
jgi:dienelactone hydrolase